ncbi:50S ribosomal protein L25/general stress protein Ctc [Virgibacillus halodenitrificans]|uniref:Large ribosomal subunit protein bL25 n=1 Tax=Virgibacillus halodenitrificans TaxID=1482 RepID=A0AAC9IZD9_VIRHA|nr:50S ribosomal protein L25/general stress protein Ctc [Virgibacillus halodenitrificans]APC46754.1 50S ribosomal protein L25/general stress protein Ctc [Virgibacillus halodenitrificans]MBD1224706.1 50S ribosomal protein L25/general stress protein Ctc [Virgibacillus halodenitrificans]MCG1030064.1 50S ribosomal protein L25/general stress protein Ctc [Virgibacillus halodenitrificans]MCJ0931643.1 50S ribosomal protein L25/general stress protein Ctc [Virgibacillus halodenitrificans]MYL44349.1 50S 
MAVKLKATKREDLTKSTTKQIRNEGRVPAVIYGKAKDAQSISVDSVELVKTVRDEGRNAIISLNIENDKPVDVMLHEYQIDPLRDELVHADFYIVNMSEEMDVEVPLRLEGEAQGSKDGGVLQQPLYELQVRAKPGDIPEEIVVDISELAIGDTIAIADLPKASNYEFLEDEDTTIATVLPPDTLDDVEEAPDENNEPELVDADAEDKE